MTPTGRVPVTIGSDHSHGGSAVRSGSIVAAFKEARVVRALPKTRSGKVLRGTIRAMADGEEWRMPATIEDPAVLDDFRDVLAGLGRQPSAATPD